MIGGVLRMGGPGRHLTHVDARGRATMVDTAAKDESDRRATARGRVMMAPATLDLVLGGGLPKGDVLACARIAGIMAAKRAHELIPLCHPLPLAAARVAFRRGPRAGVLEIEAESHVTARTGAEMEALTAVAVAALTVYDMCKAVDRGIVIGDIRLTAKSGGRSGDFRRDGEEPWREGELL
jgi:cyclic pyranopterin phosphate synthase